MKRFKYRARDAEGRLMIGEVEAQSEILAARLLRERALIVISLSLKKEGILGFFPNVRGKGSLSEVTSFTRQLSTMITAGLPITQSLLILRNQGKGLMQKVSSQVLSGVEGGESLSASMSKHPKVFSPTYIALVQSGEAGGVLDEVLASLAEDLEKQREFVGKVKGAMVYPIVIVAAMTVSGFFMLTFVIPKLLGLFEQFDAKLPLSTKILIALSNTMAKFWPLIILLGAILVYIFVFIRKTEKGRRKIDGILLNAPVIGPLQRQAVLAELTRTLSLMTGAGLSVLEGLNISAEVVGNAVIKDALRGVVKSVEKGFPIAYSFSKYTDVFPYILTQMVAVGEETGKMSEVLKKISHIFEIETDQRVKVLTSVIEPLIMIILGLGIAFLVVSVYLPIYNLSSQF